TLLEKRPREQIVLQLAREPRHALGGRPIRRLGVFALVVLVAAPVEDLRQRRDARAARRRLAHGALGMAQVRLLVFGGEHLDGGGDEFHGYLFKNTGHGLLRKTYSVALPSTSSMMRRWPYAPMKRRS